MKAEDPRSDAELVGDARGGDHGAWAALARRHGPRLAAYLGARLRRPEIVDGLVGEALVASWLRLGELTDPSGFAAWFRKTGAGLALKWAREHPDAAIDAVIPASRLPVERAGEVARLDRLIGALDEAHRMAIELRWRAGMTGESLGTAMRCHPDAAERLADEAEEQVLRLWDA